MTRVPFLFGYYRLVLAVMRFLNVDNRWLNFIMFSLGINEGWLP